MDEVAFGRGDSKSSTSVDTTDSLLRYVNAKYYLYTLTINNETNWTATKTVFWHVQECQNGFENLAE